MYEDLDAGTKSAFTRKLKEIEKLRTELVVEFEKAKKRFDTTLSLLCPPAGNLPAGSTTMTMPRAPTENVRIPQLPQFRGEGKDTIEDAYEFLGKVRTLLEAHLIPEERWYAALLTALSSFDRQRPVANLAGLEWKELERAFLHHFEYPALRDKLIRDLMTVQMRPKETVQEYSDRLNSVMGRTGKKDDEETLFAVYIDGLSEQLLDMMLMSRAAALSMRARGNDGPPPVSIAGEISNAITLDATRRRKPRGIRLDTAKRTDEPAAPSVSQKPKRCGKCRSRRHATEQHRKKSPVAFETTGVPQKSAEKPLQTDEKCFQFSKPWKPEHKYAPQKPRNLQRSKLHVVNETAEGYELGEVDSRADNTFADDLVNSIFGYDEKF